MSHNLWQIREKTSKKAVAGDIIGVYDTGNYQIGDTLFEGKLKVAYEELPSFTPELFMKVTAKMS